MKAVFFSLLALATSALAAPAPLTDGGLAAREDNSMIKRSVEAEGLADLHKRSVSTSAELVIVLKTCNSDITPQCGYVDDLIAKYKSGGITKSECASQAVPYFKKCISILEVVISKCTGTGILTVTAAEVSTIAQLVIKVVTTLLKTIASLVTACGLLSQITAILQALIAVICTLLTLICGIVPGIVLAVVSALTSLVANLSILGAYLLPLVLCLAGL